VAPGTTPAPSSALAVAARHLGRRLTIAGTLAAADRTRVRIAITRHGRTLWRGTARLRNGKFRLRLRVPRRLGRVTVVVRAGEQRVTRPVS
jgi:hypothetical protein